MTTGAAGWLTLSSDKMPSVVACGQQGDPLVNACGQGTHANPGFCLRPLRAAPSITFWSGWSRPAPPAPGRFPHGPDQANPEIYKKLLATQSLTQLDEFALETGFDPRRDVREILFYHQCPSRVMLARGTFHLNSATKARKRSARAIRYPFQAQAGSAFSIRRLQRRATFPRSKPRSMNGRRAPTTRLLLLARVK